MSYINEWHNNTLEANELLSLVIVDGENEIDVSNDVSLEDFVISSGEEDIYNTFSQETVTFSLNNAGHKYDAFEFKNKYVRFTVKTTGETGTYTTSYKSFYIDNSTVNDDYIHLECLLFNMNQARGSLDYIFNANSYTIISDAMYKIAETMTAVRMIGYSFGTWDNSNALMYQRLFNTDYCQAIYNSISTNGELIKQLTKILGGFAHIKRPIYADYPSLYITHFPSDILLAEAGDTPINATRYIYGGTFDETLYGEGDLTLQADVESEDIDVSNYDRILVDGDALGEDGSLGILYQDSSQTTHRIDIKTEYESGTTINISGLSTIKFIFNGSDTLNITYSLLDTYNTGDDIDGNTSIIDGGTFDINYIIINDDVMTDVTVGELFMPQNITATATEWRTVDGSKESNEVEIYIGDDRAEDNIDLTDVEVFKTVYNNSQGIDYNRAILSETYEELYFPSYQFEATLLNNLKLEIGQVVAIQTGVAPTRFSYIEKIVTDLFGTTTISNSRGGEQ